MMDLYFILIFMYMVYFETIQISGTNYTQTIVAHNRKMKFVFGLLLIQRVFSASFIHPMEKILGGIQTNSPIPWLVYLKITKSTEVITCAGSIIQINLNATYVLTAAHCALGATSIQALGGRYNLDLTTDQENGYEFEVFYTLIHSEYDPKTSNNDIALLAVKLLSKYSSRIVEVMPIAQDYDESTKSFTAYGWGLTSPNSKTSSTLMTGYLLPVTIDQCASFFGKLVAGTNVICAGNQVVSTCAGDSGSGLTAVDSNGVTHLVGLTSFGDKICGLSPSGFTKVSAYKDWILATTTQTSALKFQSSGFFIHSSLVMMQSLLFLILFQSYL